MTFHEERKFREWASKVENDIQNRNYKLKDSCKRLIFWSRRIEDLDASYYSNNIRDYEFSLISNSVPIIFDDYYKNYLRKSKKHGKFTKARHKKIASFVYQFVSFLLPLAEEIQANNFLKEKIQEFIKSYLPDMIFDLSNIGEHEIHALLKLVLKAEELGLKQAPTLKKTIETEILTRQLEEEIIVDLKGESVQVEFKEKVPDNLSKIAKEIAAFASTQGGRIYLGITDEGDIVGLKDNGPNWFDKLQQRIENIVYGTVKPTPAISVELYTMGEKMVVQIRVPKGFEPMYFYRNVPYIRRLTSSKPATPTDVKRLHLSYFIEALERSAK